MSGFPRPRWRILGTELAGTVEAAGPAVTQFAAGDEVFGVNAYRFGAHAEFVCVRERGPLALKPAGMSFEEAAAVCDGAILALGCLRAAGVGKGRSILVYGASGSIGTAAVQLARHLEADVVFLTSVVGSRKVLFPIPPKYTKKDVLFLRQLIEEGHYRAVVDRRYPLDDVVDATAYVETKQKTGNVVLTVAR